MLELIGITLAITLGCNVLAGIGSYVTLYTDLFAGQRLQTRSYRADTFWKRLPLIAFNLTILTALTVVGLAMGYTAFDFGWQGGALVVGQFLFLVFLDDAYFYFFHRLLHVNPYLYKKKFIKFITEHSHPFRSSTSTSIPWSGCLVPSRFQLDSAVFFS